MPSSTEAPEGVGGKQVQMALPVLCDPGPGWRETGVGFKGCSMYDAGNPKPGLCGNLVGWDGKGGGSGV